MNKKVFSIVAALLLVSVAGLFAQAATSAAEVPAQEAVMTPPPVPQGVPVPPAQADEAKSDTGSIKFIAAAIAVGLACIAGGMAVGKIGSATMGAMSENAELSGKALPFVGLAEGICLWGFLVALLIIIL